MSALSRRHFLALGGSAAAAAMSGRSTTSAEAAMGPADKFDLVIKGGDVLDPSQSLRGKRDIGIRWGVIEAIEPEIPPARASKTIDASGKLVTPGLIDLQCPVSPYGSALGIPADELVQFQGTPTVVSAGDAGVNNLAALRRFIVAQSRARIYAFVHIANNGLSAFPVAELYNIDNAQVEACAMALAENPDFLIGVKVRMSENVIFKHGLEPLKRAIQACEMCGWPAKMMVHIGGVETKELMSQILDLLRPGDVLTHAYSGAPNIAGAFTNIVQDGKLLPAALAAKQRGVIFDVGPGGGSDPRRLHAGHDLLRHPRIFRQFAGRAISAQRHEQVHADGLFAGAGGDDGDHGAGEDHQPGAEDRHAADRRARRRRDQGAGGRAGVVPRYPQQQARRQGLPETGPDRHQWRSVRPAVSIAVRGEVTLGRALAAAKEVQSARAAAAMSAASAIKDATRKPPNCSDRKPASVGPTIWPMPKLAVIRPNARWEFPADSNRAAISPSAVRPMKVPPSSSAEKQTPGIVTHSTLAATPTASTAQAAA